MQRMLAIVLPVLSAGLYLDFGRHITRPRNRWLWWHVSIAMVAIIGFSVGAHQNLPDFTRGYYYAGRNIMNDNILHNPRQLYPFEYCTEAYANFPLFAYLFVPFKFLSEKLAIQIFYALSWLSVMLITFVLIKLTGLSGWKTWVMIILLMTNGPLLYSLSLGNITQYNILLMAFALLMLKNGRELLSGILLGFNGLIKIPLALPAGYFCFRRRWMVIWGGVLLICLVVVSSLFLPFQLNKMWLDKCILSSAGYPIAAHNNQSVVGVLARHLIPGSDVENWLPIEPTPDFGLLTKFLDALFCLPAILVLFIGWKAPRSFNMYVFELFILITCSFLISPITWTHYLALLLIPAAFYLKEIVFDRHSFWMNVLFCISLILLSIPVSATFMLFNLTGQQILLSFHFIGCVIFYVFLLLIWFGKRRREFSHLAVSI